MADPRKSLSFEGIGGVYATYKHDSTIVYSDQQPNGSVSVGKAVTLVGEAAGTVSLVGNAELVEGKLILVEHDGYCNVQTAGYCSLPGGTSATLTQGSTFYGDLGGVSTTDEGYIQAGTTAGSARGAIVDGTTDATAVVVRL